MIQPRSKPARRQLRRELLAEYVELQRQIASANPLSSSYRAAIHAFRHMGYRLITAGFEDDLDRLLRIRVLDGGRASRSQPSERTVPSQIFLIEKRAP
jgi:hypothetical protein